MRFLHNLYRMTAAAAVALALAAAPAGAADMNKVIRHVFPVGEEGFDPAASSDLYSGTVNQAVFETLLTYDYLARPAKLVPLAAEALPQVTDNGQTYTIKVRKGIQFAAGPGVQGGGARARRRRLRLFAQAAHGSEDPLAMGLAARRQDRRPRRAGRAGEEDGHVRLRGQDSRARGGRSLHAAHPAEAARLQPRLRARARADQRRRPRSRRRLCRRGRAGDGESGRHRTVQAREVGPVLEDLPRGESRLSRLRLGFQGRAPIPTTRGS